MKRQELQKLIQEEIQKVLKEAEAPIYTDWEENVNPDYIVVHLKDGRKLQISKKHIAGGQRVYQAILQAFSDQRTEITNKIVGAMASMMGGSLKETYYNPEWKLTSIQDWIETYAMNNRLNFKLLKKVDKKSGTGSKTTFYVYDIGDKHGIVIKDDKVAGAPRLSEIDVIIGLKGSALGSLSKSYTMSGSGGSQQELIKLLDKVLGPIKEGQELTEGNIMIFSYAKPYKKPDASKIRAEADKYIKFLQSKNFNVHTGSDALYFPNFVWAGGKQQLGECIGVLAGSETIVVSPIGENKTYRFGESLLARFVKDDRIPAFLIKGSND
jgi:hypothetical protein